MNIVIVVYYIKKNVRKNKKTSTEKKQNCGGKKINQCKYSKLCCYVIKK